MRRFGYRLASALALVSVGAFGVALALGAMHSPRLITPEWVAADAGPGVGFGLSGKVTPMILGCLAVAGLAALSAIAVLVVLLVTTLRRNPGGAASLSDTHDC